MTYPEMIAVLQEAQLGKQIQQSLRGKHEWYDCPTPVMWNFEDYDFRVRVEPRSFYRAEFEDKVCTGFYSLKREAARSARESWGASHGKYRVVEYREVM